ncbi:hypothetical protein JRQ81_006172 [Phrynocephalus forsythii]|uniref:Alpha-ketoglutarate-dependent dioxygenase FTO C-terminal domain-containing protein n=1 Tax=Phrynocephalus forsythii TaxID=171643 RepID=A0A9Q0XE81_9SAUR|nr:hypothetical protein JRQ81_006172 [Phrynocephalus forsythii]
MHMGNEPSRGLKSPIRIAASELLLINIGEAGLNQSSSLEVRWCRNLGQLSDKHPGLFSIVFPFSDSSSPEQRTLGKLQTKQGREGKGGESNGFAKAAICYLPAGVFQDVLLGGEERQLQWILTGKKFPAERPTSLLLCELRKEGQIEEQRKEKVGCLLPLLEDRQELRQEWFMRCHTPLALSLPEEEKPRCHPYWEVGDNNLPLPFNLKDIIAELQNVMEG